MARSVKITISAQTRTELSRMRAPGETYSAVIQRLLGEAGVKAYEPGWNRILAEEEFISLSTLNEIQKRLDEARGDPSIMIPWSEVKKRMSAKKRKGTTKRKA